MRKYCHQQTSQQNHQFLISHFALLNIFIKTLRSFYDQPGDELFAMYIEFVTLKIYYINKCITKFIGHW